MTPQSSFMVLGAILPQREAELRGLLESMNDAPGRVNASNALIPFAQFGTLHVARLLVLQDNSLDDVGAYGLPRGDYPLYLAFLGNVDGEADTFFEDLARRASTGLRALFSCCEGFTADANLVEWMKTKSRPSIAAYTNWLGRTVARIREEAALHDAIQRYLQSSAPTLANLRPKEIHAALKRYLGAETSAGRLTLSQESPTPLSWSVRNLLHKVGLPLLALIASPILIPVGLILTLLLRRLEKTDPELCPRVAQAYSDALARLEDHDVTNQFTAMGSLKPGIVRLCTAVLVLRTIDWELVTSSTAVGWLASAPSISRVGSSSTTTSEWSSSATTMEASKAIWMILSTNPDLD